MGISNTDVAKNVIWRYSERILAQFITFFVSLILARLLTPDDYGVIALVATIISIFDVLGANGFPQAIVQKKEISDADYSTSFIANLFMEFLLYAIVFFTAPLIAFFYENDDLITVFRVLGLSLIINAFNSVQKAYVQRNMLYKKFFFSTLYGTLVSAVLGIFFAFKGFGIWALVIQSLSNTIIDTFVLFITIDLKPKLFFSINSLKQMSRYGIKLQISAFGESILNEIRTFVIGKLYSASELAYYNKGRSLPTLIISSIQMSVGDVFFSVLSRESSDTDIKNRVREYYSLMFYILCPLLIGLFFVSKPLIIVLFSEKWIPSIFYVNIFSFLYLTWIFQMVMLQAFKASERLSDIMIVSIGSKIIDLILLFLTMKKGVAYIAYASLGTNIIASIYIYIRVHHIFLYTFKEFSKDTIPTLLITFISLFPIILFQKLNISNTICLALSIVVSVPIYLFLSFFLKLKSFYSFIQLSKNIIRRK